jgi:biotin carboxyl carrier protein
MEAMKMEHTVKSSLDGVVGKINCKEGAFADAGKVLITIE